MAHYRHEFVEPARAASQINCWEPVRGLAGSSSIDETIIPARGSANPVLGISIATVASPGDSAAYVTAGRARGIAAASLGAFSPVGADASGMLRPLTAGAAASVIQQQVGVSVEAAVAGQIFTILLKPGQLPHVPPHLCNGALPPRPERQAGATLARPPLAGVHA